MSLTWASTSAERADWDALLLSHAWAAPNLLSWYLDHQRLPRTQIEIATISRNGKAAAGAVLYTFTLPVPGRPAVCIVPSSPICAKGQEGLIPELLDALVERARTRRCMVLQFEAFEPLTRDVIRDHFAALRLSDYPVWRLYHPTLWREYRVDLREKTPRTLLDSFTSDARRRIGQALKSGTELLEVRDDAGMAEAHKLWTSAGQRKDYTIRPLENFSALVRAAWENNAGALLLSRVEGKPAAFVFALFYGRGAMFMSSGHDPLVSKGFANIVLQYRQMCLALERGAEYYGLGGPSTAGIREFKEGFRPYLVDNMRFVSVILRPFATGLFKPFIGQSRLVQQAKRWAVAAMQRRK